jgi:hypothetical protein
MPELTLSNDGARHLPAALSADDITALEAALSELPKDSPGIRLRALPDLAVMLGADGVIGRHAAIHLGRYAQPIRAILFDKTPLQNWALGWHQDRTIAVKSRIDAPGFGPWTIKSGIQHVAPPQELLDRMLTLRVHLDPVPATNAPLLIARGTHRHGRITEGNIGPVVDSFEIHTCLAERGDIWAYATPILHASEAASNPGHRRVLQIDYSVDTLPSPLEWAGI